MCYKARHSCFVLPCPWSLVFTEGLVGAFIAQKENHYWPSAPGPSVWARFGEIWVHRQQPGGVHRGSQGCWKSSLKDICSGKFPGATCAGNCQVTRSYSVMACCSVHLILSFLIYALGAIRILISWVIWRVNEIPTFKAGCFYYYYDLHSLETRLDCLRFPCKCLGMAEGT